jgi:hypothetical protein
MAPGATPSLLGQERRHEPFIYQENCSTGTAMQLLFKAAQKGIDPKSRI